MSLRKVLLALSLSSMAVCAQAGLVDTTLNQNISIQYDDMNNNSSTVVVPTNNDFLDADGSLSYNVGGNIFAEFDLELTFTFLGKEAGFKNDFNALGNTIQISNTEAVDADGLAVNPTVFTGFTSAGLIDFNFVTDLGGAPEIPTTLVNGANQPFNSPQSFATLLDFTWSNNITYDFILFFDDSGFANDDNHDDHIIGVTASRLDTSEVSSPGIIALFGLSLLALGFIKRRNA